MIEYIWLIPVGIVISTFASIIGIGGGLLWAPFFILILKMDSQTAVIYSFAIQIVGMGSATISNILKKTIYWKIIIIILPFILFGEFLGSYVSQRMISSEILQASMGVMSIIVSLFFAFQPERYDVVLNNNRKAKPPAWLALFCIPFGSFSGLFSVGIGDNLVPLLRSKMKIAMSNAIGTSLFLNLIISIIGLSFHFSISSKSVYSLNYNVLFMSWFGVLIGGQIGPNIGGVIEDNRLKEIFIFILMLIGIHLIYKAL